MDVKELFKNNYNISVEHSWCAYNGRDMVGFAESYHQAKSKEEAEQRLNKAWEYLEERASREEGGVVSYGRGGYIIDSLYIASGKE